MNNEFKKFLQTILQFKCLSFFFCNRLAKLSFSRILHVMVKDDDEEEKTNRNRNCYITVHSSDVLKFYLFFVHWWENLEVFVFEAKMGG